MAADLDFGKIGYTDRGDWVSGYNSGSGYEYLDSVSHNNCYWISLENNNLQTPSVSSSKWHMGLDGKTASQAAASASSAASGALAASSSAVDAATSANSASEAAASASQYANEAADAAMAAVVVAELPEVALESAVRAIVSSYTPSE